MSTRSSVTEATLAFLVLATTANSQVVAESFKLLAPAGANQDYFGASVAVEDGLIASGAFWRDSVANNAGSVFCFRRAGAQVILEQELAPQDLQVGSAFGASLAMKEGRLVVGAPCDKVFGVMTGSAYVFARTGSTWTFEDKLWANNGAHADQFGNAVISGTTIVVAAQQDDHLDPGNLSTDSGAAYVFEESGSSWTETQKLVPGDLEPLDRFGSALAIEDDVLCVTTIWDDDRGTDAGAAYVFEHIGGVWTQTAKLTASDGGTLQRFGSSTSLGAGYLVVGAAFADNGDGNRGAAYVFERIGGAWTETAKIFVPGTDVFRFADRAIEIDGSNIVVGALASGGRGAAFVFSPLPSGWALGSELVPSDLADGDAFGLSVCASGGITVVSSPDDDDVARDSGSAYVFLTGAPSSYCTGRTTSQGCVPFLSVVGLPSVSPTEPFRIHANEVLPGEAGFLMYAFKKSNLDFHGGKLCLKPPVIRLLPLKSSSSQGSPPCDGAMFRNFNNRIQGGNDPLLTAGQAVRCQWIQRDPTNGFHRDNLTDAVQFTVAP